MVITTVDPSASIAETVPVSEGETIPGQSDAQGPAGPGGESSEAPSPGTVSPGGPTPGDGSGSSPGQEAGGSPVVPTNPVVDVPAARKQLTSIIIYAGKTFVTEGFPFDVLWDG